jgi:hypothetical protein
VSSTSGDVTEGVSKESLAGTNGADDGDVGVRVEEAQRAGAALKQDRSPL